MRRSGRITGLSASAIADESTSIGIPFSAKARVSAETPDPGERRMTAISDHGTPSMRCAVRKACAM